MPVKGSTTQVASPAVSRFWVCSFDYHPRVIAMTVLFSGFTSTPTAPAYHLGISQPALSPPRNVLMPIELARKPKYVTAFDHAKFSERLFSTAGV